MIASCRSFLVSSAVDGNSVMTVKVTNARLPTTRLLPGSLEHPEIASAMRTYHKHVRVIRGVKVEILSTGIPLLSFPSEQRTAVNRHVVSIHEPVIPHPLRNLHSDETANSSVKDSRHPDAHSHTSRPRTSTQYHPRNPQPAGHNPQECTRHECNTG